MRKHVLSSIIFILIFSCGMQQRGFANIITLTKTGGNNTLYTSGITLASGYSPSTLTNSIVYDEVNIGTIVNWTDIFHTIADIINYDSENELNTVSYAIDIDAPSASNPIRVGRQNLTLATKFAEGTNILYFKGDMHTALPINKITISTNNPMAYIKFIDGLYYGSWLKPGQTVYYYDFNYLLWNQVNHFYSNINPCPSSSSNPWDCNLVQSSITSGSIQNSSSINVALSDLNVPLGVKWTYITDPSLESDIGCFINAENCNHLTVQKMDVDGNISNCKIGGVYGDYSTQSQFTGLHLFSSKNSTIESCAFHHFGLDGMDVSGASDVIDIIDCKLNYNGRQGFSWVGGSNVHAINCQFNNSGRALAMNGLPYSSNPSASLDIEPDSPYSCLHGVFDNCEFINPAGQCVGMDRFDPILAALTYDFKFNHCRFHKIDGYGLWCKGQKIRFNDCDIDCKVINAGYGYGIGLLQDIETIYTNCRFEDMPLNGNPMESGYLVDVQTSKKLTFDECTFTVNDYNREFLFLEPDSYLSEDEYSIIKDCHFIYKNEGVLNSGPNISVLDGVRFKGYNKVENILSNNCCSHHGFKVNNIILEGSTNACQPSVLEFKGQTELWISGQYNGNPGPSVATEIFSIGKIVGGGDGYAELKLNTDTRTEIYSQSKIDIYPNASLQLLPEATVNDGGIIHLEGKFIAHPHSYVNLNYCSFNTNLNANPLLYFDKNCNYNNVSSSPVWQNVNCLGNSVTSPVWTPNWIDPSHIYSICVQGGYSSTSAPNVVFNSVCNPTTYTNIQSNDVFSIMYNTIPISLCSNANSGQFSFQVSGGTPPYNCTWNGGTLSNPMSNLTTGIYTLVVTDASSGGGCSGTFLIEIGNPFTDNLNFTNVTCSTQNDGSIHTTVAGATTYTLNPGNTTNSTGTFLNLSPNTYTITATDGTCSKTTTVILVSPPSAICCNTEFGSASTKLFFDNTTASNYSTNTHFNNVSIFVNGTYTVDQNMTFTNCHFFFTANAQILVYSTQILYMNNCTLKAGCGEMWNGIYAENETDIQLTACTLEDMSSGVQMKNDGVLSSKNCTYLNNAVSIQFNKIEYYSGAVVGNTFISDANFIPQLGGFITQGVNGIIVKNCRNVTIGSPSSSSNHFKKLMNGINIAADANMATVLGNNISQIFVLNNSFENIHNTLLSGSSIPAQKINNCYTSGLGAGVVVDYGNCPQNVQANITLANTTDNSNTPAFTDCDKAVVTVKAALTASKLHIYNSLLGIMNMSGDGLHYNLNDNTISESAMVGIQCIGDIAQSNVLRNTIQVNTNVIDVANIYQIAPKAIDINFYNKLNAETVMINDNNIVVPGRAGVGIHLQNTGVNTNVNHNLISLSTTTPGGIQSSGDKALNGIQANNVEGTKLNTNHIVGTNELLLANRNDISAIQINTSKNMEMRCNNINKTRFGIQAVGNCTTGEAAIQGNLMYDHVLGWAFRHLGDEGTFGNVGKEGNSQVNGLDNHNLFTGSNYATNGQVFKFCKVFDGNKIFTDLSTLIQSQSGSFNVVTATLNDCRYAINQNLGTVITYNCPVNPIDIPTSGSNNYILSEDEGVLIATNTKEYAEFPEIAHWIDARRLYEQLVRDTTFRNSNQILLDFYTATQNDAIHQIQLADIRLSELVHNMQIPNGGSFGEDLGDADEANDAIDDTEFQDANERSINSIYIKLLRWGKDSLNIEDSLFIAELANQCPYIAGTAVYKARTLNGIYAPANTYDDLIICNNAGVYKNNGGNGKGLFEDENKYLQSLKTNQDISKGELIQNELLVYPNPTNTQINIRYKEERATKLQIVNMLGIVVKEINLPKYAQIVTTSVSDLIAGVYTYKQVYQKEIIHTGKLIILY